MFAFTLEQLTALRTIIDEGTFEAAAVHLHITASAVSQRIKAMEQAAGRVLVQRTNPVQTTSAGDIVLKYARQADLLAHDTTRALGDQSSSISLPIAVNADSLSTWFLEALVPFTADSRSTVDLYRDDQEHTTALLRSGSVLAAVTSTPEPVQGCTSEPLGVMRYLAVCTREFVSRWASSTSDDAGPDPTGPDPADTQRTSAELNWLHSAPMVNFDRKDDLQFGFLRALRSRETPPASPPSSATEAPATAAPTAAAATASATASAEHPPIHYIPTSADFARSIMLGLGWGLLPEQQCSAALERGELVQLSPGHPADVRLYWQRWNLDSPTLTALTAAVRAGATRSLRPF